MKSGSMLMILASTLHSVDASIGILEDAAIIIDGEYIRAVGRREELRHEYADIPVLDKRPCMLIPGLIDVHHHPGLYFFSRLRPRLSPPQLGLLAGGGKIELFLSHLSAGMDLTQEETAAAATASLLRGLKSGVTYFNDGAGGHVQGLIEAARSLRLRGILTYGFGSDMAFEQIPSHAGGECVLKRIAQTDAILQRAQTAVAAIDQHEGLDGWYNITCDLTSSDDLYRMTCVLAYAQGCGINTHTSTVRNHDIVSQRLFGKTSTRRLLDLGVIGPKWIGAHMGFLDEHETRDLALVGGNVAHCPGTSMGAGKGILTSKVIPFMRQAGVNVALGTDSAQWADMVGQMSLAFYGHKEAMEDDTVLTPEEVLKMATLDSAFACGKADQMGSLTPGKRADLLMISTENTRFSAFTDPLFAWLRSGHSADVAGVWLGGERRVWQGEVSDVDEGEIVHKALLAADSYLKRCERS
jgi:5-methylthioadenosine/S-adenosylhomocysteine deaminase